MDFLLFVFVCGLGGRPDFNHDHRDGGRNTIPVFCGDCDHLRCILRCLRATDLFCLFSGLPSFVGRGELRNYR